MSILARLKSLFNEFIPMSVICWREGYRKDFLLADIRAGITVGLIALPLAMAFAIGSGVAPARGLYTAIFAGFLISLLGGSRVQIGGPTGAFIIIVYDVIQRHGYEGLAIATFIAGIMMIIMGLARFGFFLKFIPYPVTVGFTTGIALVIFSSQMKDFFGLNLASVPADFIEKWTSFWQHASTWNPWAATLSASTLLLIFLFRRINPKFPGVIIAVILATLAAIVFKLPVETIESKFGVIPDKFPIPCLPKFPLDQIPTIFPDAIAIALLGAIESLLSALVADGMTGHRHRSNSELVAQGLANIGSVFFGGIPATGAIARTTANIKMGAKTPVSGMLHAVTLLFLMLVLAPAASKVPLPALAAVLIFVAWNMSELHHFFAILRGQRSDALVLLITFLLTVLVDLTAAVQVGALLAAILFIKRMSDATTVKICQLVLEENVDEHPAAHDSELILRKDVPENATVFEITGPFFFAVSDLLNEQLRQMDVFPKTFILRMHKVPAIDASGVHAIQQFAEKCRQANITFLLSGVNRSLGVIFKKTGIDETIKKEHIFRNLNDALSYARQHS